MFILYFTGGIGEDGKSWCPPCNSYKATIEEKCNQYYSIDCFKRTNRR